MGSTVPSWILLVSALASPLVSIGVAWITLRFTTKRERDRQDHEREMKQVEIEEAKRTDRRKERLQAYRTMARITKTVDPSKP